MAFISGPEAQGLLKDSAVEGASPQSVAKQLQNKLRKLEQIEEEESQKLRKALTEQKQLKQSLAECIRQSHINTTIIKKELSTKELVNIHEATNKDQIKIALELRHRELQHLEETIGKIKADILMNCESEFYRKQELEQLGQVLEELQQEAQQSKEQQEKVIQEVQQMNATYSILQNNLNQQKATYQSLQNQLKQCQTKQNEIQANTQIYENESKKIDQEISKLRPKLEKKVVHLQELEALKNRIVDQLGIKNDELLESRKQVQLLEDEFNAIPSYEKQIAVERKAQTALETERKLLMTQFERICKHTGIDQISENLVESQESQKDKAQQQQELIQSQQEQIKREQDELSSLQEQHQLLTQKRDRILEQYLMVEKQMDVLGQRYSVLNKHINQKI